MHLHSNPPLAFLNISQREMETYSHTKTLHTKVQLRLWQKLDIIFTSVYELVNGEWIYKLWKIHTNAGLWGCPWQPGTALYTLELFCFIQKRIMASGPITSWHRDEVKGNNDRLHFGGSKITLVGDCSLEIKRRLLFGRKAMTNPDSILKSRATLCQQRSIESKLWFLQQSCMDVRAGP